MLVIKERQKLLLNLKNPQRVEALIPSAKRITIKEKQVVAVDHTLDAVHVLNNIGIKAPSPIEYYYKWPGKYKPFKHQIETAAFCTLNPRCFVLSDMGTGKTLSVLWAFDFLKQTGAVDWALVISPLSTLERAWADEVFRNFPHLSFGVVHGTRERRMKVAKDNYDVYIINHDGIVNKELLEHFCRKSGEGVIIIDELAVFRNASTVRWRSLNTLVNGHPKANIGPKRWVWGLTGTPIPNEPTDAWAQCKLVRPEAVPKYFTRFREMTMLPVSQFKWAARSDALDTVYNAMRPAVRFSRADCIDLPPTTTVDRTVELTPEQSKMYKQMLNQLRAEYAGGQITAVNEAVKMGKLLQIVLGCAYGQDGELIHVPTKPRVDTLLEVVEEAKAKVIVFVPLTGALNALAAEVGKHHSVSVVHGGVSKAARDEIFHDFMQPSGARVLIAQPGTMAHGLTLTAADTIVWYAPTTSSETYQQANARIVRPGQTRNTLIVRLQGSELERRMYQRLERRETVQGALLGMFEEGG